MGAIPKEFLMKWAPHHESKISKLKRYGPATIILCGGIRPLNTYTKSDREYLKRLGLKHVPSKRGPRRMRIPLTRPEKAMVVGTIKIFQNHLGAKLNDPEEYYDTAFHKTSELLKDEIYVTPKEAHSIWKYYKNKFS